MLFAQAQQSPCDSLAVSGSQYQLTFTSASIIDFWETTAPDGTILGQDSSWNMHSIYNNSSSGLPYDTIITCLYTINTVCCIIYVWNGSSWIIPGTSSQSWDCAPNTFLGCSDPGTGLGQYSSLSACQSACSIPCPGIAIIAQNTNIFTTNVTGGIAPYTYLWNTGETTQSITATANISGYCDVTDADSCVYSANYSYTSGQFVACDSLIITSTGGSNQTFLQISLNTTNLPILVDYWFTYANDSTILGEDSMSMTHDVYNLNPITTQPYDTINTCLTYTMNSPSVITCCVTWIWNGTSWSKLGSASSVGEINSTEKKLISIVDFLGRVNKGTKNEPLFYIYDDGTVEKKYKLK